MARKPIQNRFKAGLEKAMNNDIAELLPGQMEISADQEVSTASTIPPKETIQEAIDSSIAEQEGIGTVAAQEAGSTTKKHVRDTITPPVRGEAPKYNMDILALLNDSKERGVQHSIYFNADVESTINDLLKKGKVKNSSILVNKLLEQVLFNTKA